jgi:hypothetical protein
LGYPFRHAQNNNNRLNSSAPGAQQFYSTAYEDRAQETEDNRRFQERERVCVRARASGAALVQSRGEQGSARTKFGQRVIVFRSSARSV